jgi:regulator of sigma E protease
MISLLAFIFVLSILILVHEFGHFFAAKRLGVRIERFSLGFGPVIFMLKRHQTEYCLSFIPLGGYVKMAGDNPAEGFRGESWEYLSQPIKKRMAIVLAGPALNYLLAFLVFWLVFSTGYPAITTKVGDLVKDYPGQNAGIQKEDRILKVDGQDVRTWEEMTQIIHKTQKDTLDLLLKREEKIVVLTLKPRREKVTNIFGQEEEIALIGIRPSEEMIKVRYPVSKSWSLAAKKLWSLTSLTFTALGRIVTGKMALRESVSGPLGIFFITKFAAEVGLASLFNLLAVLSASLAIFNILPIPVLDGGHILFLFIEKVRGKAATIKMQERITQVGIAFLVVLMIFVFYNDLIRFQIIEKIVRLWRK